MNNIIDILITDRTQADVDRARYLNSLWDARAGRWRGTAEEWAEWAAGPRGAYGFNDMNRVTRMAAYLAERLQRLGYAVGVLLPPAYVVQAVASPSSGGTVRGGGIYYAQENAAVYAMPVFGYEFVRWMDGGKTVSTEQEYGFVVDGPRQLTAVFQGQGDSARGVVGVGRIGLAKIGMEGE